MQITHQRGIAVGTLIALTTTTLGGLGTPVAHAGSNTWRNIAIGAGVLTGYGLLKHRRSVAVLGGVATGLSYLKYRKERKNEKQAALARSQSYAYHPAYRYSSASPYRYSSAPTRYSHHSYARHVYHRATYPYHAALHYPYHPALHHAAYPYHLALHHAAIVAPVAALAAVPVAKRVLAAHPAPKTVTAVATPVASATPVIPIASAAPIAPASNPLLPFGLGVLASLTGVGLGFGLANAKRRQTPVETPYTSFEPPHRVS